VRVPGHVIKSIYEDAKEGILRNAKRDTKKRA
jgi:hypothetical protein